MHKIDHPTATPDNNFTEGNPQTAVKPTVVTADILNALQNEIANFIVSRGLVLDKADNTQLSQALAVLNTTNDESLPILNNQINTLMGATFEFDITKIKSAIIEIDIYRKDAGQERSSTGHIHILGKPIAGTFEVIPMLFGDEDTLGVVFDIDNALGIGKLKYSSSNFAGANYDGKIIYKVKKFKI